MAKACVDHFSRFQGTGLTKSMQGTVMTKIVQQELRNLVKDKDYSVLVGEEIEYTNDDATVTGIVAGCDPEIGVTIAGKNGVPLICLMHPDVYYSKGLGSFRCISSDTMRQWFAEFHMLVWCIMVGYYRCGMFRGTTVDEIDGDHCAFR